MKISGGGKSMAIDLWPFHSCMFSKDFIKQNSRWERKKTIRMGCIVCKLQNDRSNNYYVTNVGSDSKNGWLVILEMICEYRLNLCDSYACSFLQGLCNHLISCKWKDSGVSNPVVQTVKCIARECGWCIHLYIKTHLEHRSHNGQSHWVQVV